MIWKYATGRCTTVFIPSELPVFKPSELRSFSYWVINHSFHIERATTIFISAVYHCFHTELARTVFIRSYLRSFSYWASCKSVSACVPLCVPVLGCEELTLKNNVIYVCEYHIWGQFHEISLQLQIEHTLILLHYEKKSSVLKFCGTQLVFCRSGNV